MFIIKNKKIFFAITILFVMLSLGSIGFLGLSPSVDFNGGSIMEVSYPNGKPEKAEIEKVLGDAGVDGYSVRATGENGYIIRTPEIKEDVRNSVVENLSFGNTNEVVQERFSTVGPTVSNELKSKATLAIVIVVAIIILYIAFAFRGVSKPISSWKYGLTAIITLIGHDIMVPAGAYAVYGYYTGAQVDILFIMALLAILGYSVNDTIIIFDRVRENLRHNRDLNNHESFDDTVGRSLSQTYARSINTSLTTLLVLITLFFLGGDSTKAFVFVMLVGVIAGTYSSLALAAPLLTVWHKKGE